jgi:hypothetical protein
MKNKNVVIGYFVIPFPLCQRPDTFPRHLNEVKSKAFTLPGVDRNGSQADGEGATEAGAQETPESLQDSPPQGLSGRFAEGHRLAYWLRTLELALA